MTTNAEGAEDPRELERPMLRAMMAGAMGVDPEGGHEHEIRISDDPAAERALEATKIRSSIPDAVRALADEYVTLEACPSCGDLIRATLPDGWEQSVNATPAYAIPIVGCGSPWHYVERRGRGAWLKSMGDPIDAEPGTIRLELELRLPDASTAFETMLWPGDLRLPVAGDALELPGGIAVVSGVTFRCGIEVDATHAELEPIEQRVAAVLIAGSER